MTLNLTDTIRLTLESEIRQGQILPGQPIEEKVLIERFSASRTPVREALQQLAAQGLVRLVARVGAVVPRLSVKELLSLLELLAELEGACAKFAARRMAESERLALADAVTACEQAAQAQDWQHYELANDRFHDVIYVGSRNPYAVEQIRMIRMRSRAYVPNRFEQPRRMKKSVEEHKAIALCVIGEDAEGAQAAMISHIAIGGRDFAEFVSGIPDDFLAAAT
ncbi:GntR family transcriptional regulator [Cupriavidus basilensis OR16]|uniref:GntR family transcriptional regulator n=1 Tax=Cupriavidus basilensis OR16 TaxID=1127483 RepID=H1SGI4_9BURK|nr:GntR family transcriptional regulator [Cupriavidus basilensis]EHP38377.1 GntR family transcriptional regulator [Cupriavidus basilensis OR16]